MHSFDSKLRPLHVFDWFVAFLENKINVNMKLAPCNVSASIRQTLVNVAKHELHSVGNAGV